MCDAGGARPVPAGDPWHAGRPKFCSCMTLFALASQGSETLFSDALARWCGGQMDAATLRLTESAGQGPLRER
ncbi:MAG: DUF1810 family protein [Nitratireductor sp.]